MSFRDRFSQVPYRPARPAGWIVLAGIAVLVLVSAGLIVFWPAAGTGSTASGRAGTGSTGRAHRTQVARHAHPAAAATRAGPAHASAAARAIARPSGPPQTSCRAVAHIGDSTSVGLVSPSYLPNPAQRMQAQYAAAGATSAWVDASGGRSIVETMPGQVNGYGVATNWNRQGFRGCWVIALGTNDTANVAVGSPVGRLARIREMMSAANGQPVLWVNVRTLDTAGPWAEANMQLWNAALRQACRLYPNLRIFDWAGVAKDSWFISDGIHYTSAGYVARARLIAGALAYAFPRGGTSRTCAVG